MEEDQLLKALYSRYVRNACTREELQLFFQLVNKLESEEHIRSLLSRTWDEWEEGTALPPERVPGTFRTKRKWLRTAAVIALLAAAGLAAGRWIRVQNAPAFTEHLAGPREQLEIVLPDSSLVWLQALSRLRYREAFQGDSREVFLEGKAFFDVREDRQKSFLVHAGGITTRVLGTAFGVDAFARDSTVRVTVVRGSVEVAGSEGPLRVLHPSEQLSYNRASRSFRTSRADTAAFLARRHGKFRFEQMKLEEIARELEQWYGVTIVFTNQALRDCRYTAGFDSSIELEELLAILGEVNDIGYSIDQETKTVTLSGKGCGNISGRTGPGTRTGSGTISK